jgi:hypothetical protein
MYEGVPTAASETNGSFDAAFCLTVSKSVSFGP